MTESKGGAPSVARIGGAVDKAADPLIGRVINDRFRVVALIARGGMGKVYKAEQAPLGREVALKVLNPSYSGEGDPEFHKRFFLEASTCSKLSHPNTVTIFDYGRTDDDVYYIVMELLEGRTLHRALREEGSLGPERTMHIARQVCRSLREAHSLGVIHRDLKPANIFLGKHGDESDFVKVLDFGLVKDIDGSGEDLTQTGLFMGSPKYMSPEQIKGERVDGRADVYALGVIMYEMLTGKVPFDRPNSVNILMAHVHDPPPPLRESNPSVQVPHALTELVMTALAKAPADRFAGMDEMLVALKNLASDTGLSVSRSMEIGLDAAGSTGSFAPVGAGGGDTIRHDSFTPEAAALPAPSGAVSGDPVSVSEPPAARRSTAPYWVAAIGALALVGALGIALAFRGQEERPRESGRVLPPPTPATDEPEEPTPAPAPRTMVQLRSEPPGAMVRVGEAAYGPTPTDIEWVGADATRGRRVTLVFRLEGHQDYSVTRVVTGDTLEVEAHLEAIRPAPRPTGRRPVRRGGSGAGGPPVKGYKLDPY